MDEDIQFLINKASEDALERSKKSICEYPGQLGFRIHRIGDDIRYVIGYLDVAKPYVGQHLAERGEFIPLAIRTNQATTREGLDGEVGRVIEFLGSNVNRFHIISQNEVYRLAEKGLRFQSGNLIDA